jgi:hypothetical protein
MSNNLSRASLRCHPNIFSEYDIGVRSIRAANQNCKLRTTAFLPLYVKRVMGSQEILGFNMPALAIGERKRRKPWSENVFEEIRFMPPFFTG